MRSCYTTACIVKLQQHWQCQWYCPWCWQLTMENNKPWQSDKIFDSDRSAFSILTMSDILWLLLLIFCWGFWCTNDIADIVVCVDIPLEWGVHTWWNNVMLICDDLPSLFRVHLIPTHTFHIVKVFKKCKMFLQLQFVWWCGFMSSGEMILLKTWQFQPCGNLCYITPLTWHWPGPLSIVL